MQSKNTLGHDGHRERVLKKFLQYGGDVFADYELLELLLMQAIPRKDVKPLAKELLARFGNLSAVIQADPEQLKQIKGIGEHTVAFLKMVLYAGQRITREKLNEAPVFADW